MVSEPASISYNKENTEVVTNTFDSPICSSIPEKKSIEQRINETFPLPSAGMDSEVANPLATNENLPANDINLDESVAIVIQAATQGYLVYSFLSCNYLLYSKGLYYISLISCEYVQARREFQKLKSVVKLQAAVRGQLVRRQAIGTLRCVQAIVKLQAHVRARCAEKSAAQEVNLQVHA